LAPEVIFLATGDPGRGSWGPGSGSQSSLSVEAAILPLGASFVLLSGELNDPRLRLPGLAEREGLLTPLTSVSDRTELNEPSESWEVPLEGLRGRPLEYSRLRRIEPGRPDSEGATSENFKLLERSSFEDFREATNCSSWGLHPELLGFSDFGSFSLRDEPALELLRLLLIEPALLSDLPWPSFPLVAGPI
jgi:hypothetical protein